MDGYYVVGIIAIPYIGFGLVINIVSKEDIAYRVTIGNITYCTCLDITKMSFLCLGKNSTWLRMLVSNFY